MRKEPENMIKGAIGETIIEEMFKELGFFVMRLGKEHTVNPLTQIQEFIKHCDGKFCLEKTTYEIREISHVNLLPDFVIVHPNGQVNLLEVKFRWNGDFNDNIIFDVYPEAHVLIVNLKPSNELIELSNKLKDTRFHIWFREDCVKDNKPLGVCPLSEWLDVEFKIQKQDILEKYEKLVDKWLRKEDIY